MCDFCVAATVGEAERYYANIRSGKTTDLMTHFGGNQTPRADLLFRQRSELADPTFLSGPEDAAFRADLQALCDNFGTDGWPMLVKSHPFFVNRESDWSFESYLVKMRRFHKREVYSNEDLLRIIEDVKNGHAKPTGLEQQSLQAVTG